MFLKYRLLFKPVTNSIAIGKHIDFEDILLAWFWHFLQACFFSSSSLQQQQVKVEALPGNKQQQVQARVQIMTPTQLKWVPFQSPSTRSYTHFYTPLIHHKMPERQSFYEEPSGELGSNGKPRVHTVSTQYLKHTILRMWELCWRGCGVAERTNPWRYSSQYKRHRKHEKLSMVLKLSETVGQGQGENCPRYWTKSTVSMYK